MKIIIKDMILADFLMLARLGAEQPLDFWKKDYEIVRQRIIPELQTLVNKVPKKSKIGRNLVKIEKVLTQEQPNEFALAKDMQALTDLFRDERSTKKKKLVDEFLVASSRFYARSRKTEFQRVSREKLKSTLSKNGQKKHDHQLFATTGMMYCLEYHLVFYKAISDAPNAEAKRVYIESPEVDMGSGRLPGLWIDFQRDEVLTKFIGLILDDALRETLTRAYYTAKLTMMKVSVVCDEHGQCTGDYTEIRLEDVIRALREWILELFKAFQEVGVDRLASFTFTPYGDKPMIRDIQLLTP